MFRFTIREVLWLAVLVGIGVAWWLDHERLTRRVWISVPGLNLLTAGLKPGEKVELETLPSGQIGTRIVPAK
jgi:hypothetical protein